MVLFVREGCHFCDQFEGTPGLVISRVVMTPRGMRARLDDLLLDVPPGLTGFPALVDGEHVYVGKAVIEERLKKAS